MYPEGYEKPAPQPLLFPDVEGGMFMDDARLKLTHEQHCRLARLVESNQAKPQRAGRRGFCAIIRALKYTHYANLFVVPVAHALLHGLIRTFWNALLKKVREASSIHLNEWTNRHSLPHPTCWCFAGAEG
jgi:hypothetical protein